MAYFSLIQFELWTCDDVANWLKGLDDALNLYIDNFITADIDGRKLLMLSHWDLEKLGLSKLGHQELVLEGVDLLRSLRYTYETENLQHLALQLGCKARSLHNEILAKNSENDPNRANIQLSRGSRRQLSISVLSSVCDIMLTLRTLTSWMDRAPFESIHGIALHRNTLVKLGYSLVYVAQRESCVPEVEQGISKTCNEMAEYCEKLVLKNESLVVQPASLEIATIRKKQEEELGMNIQSSYFGIHVIGLIKDKSPAYFCSKIEAGDEVLQVNNQTVLGWQLNKLVTALKQRPKEVTMLLKKRPKHINPFGNIPNRRVNRHVATGMATLPKSVKRKSREGDKPARPTLEYVTASVPTGDIYITKESPEDEIIDTNDDTDNDVFRSGSESPQGNVPEFTLPVIVDTSKQRRATVSGGSPTFDRPSLIADALDPAPMRPKSQAINAAERDAAIAALLAADNSVVDLREKRKSVSDPEGFQTAKPKVTITCDEGEVISTQSQVVVEVTDTSLDELDTSTDLERSLDLDISTDLDKSVFETSSDLDRSVFETPTEIEKTVDLEPSTDIEDQTANINKAVHVEDRTDQETQEETTSEEKELDAADKDQDTEKETMKQESKDVLKELKELEVILTVDEDIEETLLNEKDGAGLDTKPDTFTVTKPKPVMRGGGMTSRKSWNRNQRIISMEVAGESERGEVPRLMAMRRLDSMQEIKIDDDDVFVKPPKKVEFEVGEQKKVEEKPVLFTHVVIGGVVQKVPIQPGHESPTVRMRSKVPGSKTNLDRRVSCKDLGRGDCEGWLYKRRHKGGALAKHWVKRWCVLKEFDLFYYKTKDALKAEGVIYLPAFQVSPSTSIKTKKFAFKIHNAGTVFCFASERQDDMSKWMNKMGLASINYDTYAKAKEAATKPEASSVSSASSVRTNAYFSESEEETEDPSDRLYGSNTSLTSLNTAQSGRPDRVAPHMSPLAMRPHLREGVGASTEELRVMLTNIQSQGMTFDGQDRGRMRRSQLAGSHDLGDLGGAEEVTRLRKLHSLQRTLRAKEKELRDIEKLVNHPRAEALKHFADTHLQEERLAKASKKAELVNEESSNQRM